jgi:hypothetical protein
MPKIKTEQDEIDAEITRAEKAAWSNRFDVKVVCSRCISLQATITALQSERDRLRKALERTVKFNDVRIARAALGEKDG